MSSVAALSSSTPTAAAIAAAHSTKPPKTQFWTRVFSGPKKTNKVHHHNSSAVHHSPTAAMSDVEDDTHALTTPKTDGDCKHTTSTNVLQWLESSTCPPDVLPLVLAFSGPQTAAALSKCNRHWRRVMQSEGTWRVMCEELYKVRMCLYFDQWCELVSPKIVFGVLGEKISYSF